MLIEAEMEVVMVADLLESLGNVPAWRIRMKPVPGTATEADLIEALRRRDHICELIDGTLVEKAVGYTESRLAVFLARFLDIFVCDRNLGFVTGADGLLWVRPGRLRGPDVAFSSWSRFPEGRLTAEAYPHFSPDLAVEVLSVSNTTKEMLLKRRDYFMGGSALVWEIEPGKRTVAVYTSAEHPDVVLAESDTLTGGEVLPGFSLSLATLFGELDRRGP